MLSLASPVITATLAVEQGTRTAPLYPRLPIRGLEASDRSFEMDVRPDQRLTLTEVLSPGAGAETKLWGCMATTRRSRAELPPSDRPMGRRNFAGATDGANAPDGPTRPIGTERVVPPVQRPLRPTLPTIPSSALQVPVRVIHSQRRRIQGKVLPGRRSLARPKSLSAIRHILRTSLRQGP